MAEVTAMRNNALPYPLYGLPWVETFPLLDADGDPISPSSPDSEVSKNGDTFADCTNEATEIATSSGVCYLSLTGTEMTADKVTVRVQSTGAKTTVLNFAPRKLVSIRAGTSASGGSSTSTIVLDASASEVDDFYNGMIVVAVIDSNTEVRMISDYAGSTQTATVVPDWNVAPDNNDTFTIYNPDGVQIQQANTTHVSSTAQTARNLGLALPAVAPNTNGGLPILSNSGADLGYAVGSVTGAVGGSVGGIGSGGITSASFAAGAINAAAIADGAIDSATFASGTTIPRCTLVDTTTNLTNIVESAFNADTDKYQAKLTVVDDDTGVKDRYGLVFYKNGEPQTSGITSPTLWVYKNDATNLIGTTGSPQALSQVGSTGTYTYEEATNRIATGSLYFARVQATIASSTRTWYQIVGH